MDNDELTPQEVRHVVLQVDHFIDIMDKRYGVTPQDVVETVKWVQERRSFIARLQNGSFLTIVGMVLSALGYFVLKGFENLYRGQ
jgi:hypothetical protein